MPRVHSVYRKIGQIIFYNHISPKKVGKYMKRLIQQNILYHTYNFKTRNRIIYELQLKYLVKNDGPGLHKINLLMLQTRLYIICNPFTFNLSCFFKTLISLLVIQSYMSVCLSSICLQFEYHCLDCIYSITTIQNIKLFSSHSLFFWSLFFQVSGRFVLSFLLRISSVLVVVCLCLILGYSEIIITQDRLLSLVSSHFFHNFFKSRPFIDFTNLRH